MAVERALISVFDKSESWNLPSGLAALEDRDSLDRRNGEAAARSGRQRARRFGFHGLAGNARRTREKPCIRKCMGGSSSGEERGRPEAGSGTPHRAD